MTNNWRHHPKLQGRFHPDHPDDIQVVVHDGGPRMTDRSPEHVWVRITGVDGDVFTGEVLNQPHQLTSVGQGTLIRFLVPDGGEYALQVRDQYLRERADWIIHPCTQCGLSELFDPPSVLMDKVFPEIPEAAVVAMFTAFCGLCGGAQVVEHRDEGERSEETEGPSSKKKWWQFWK